MPRTAAAPRTDQEPAANAHSSLSTPERVAEAITKALLRREYSVGQRLVEAELTQKMGVSRSTVREALKILASRGVVEIIPHKGAAIRGLSLTDAESLLAVLEVLTGLAARLAAEKIDRPRNRQRFAAAARPLIESDEERHLEEALDRRAKFYQAMFDIADSEDLNRAVPTWRAHLFRNQFFAFHTRADVGAMKREYRSIAEAILAGDAAKAELQTRRHFQKTRERMLPHLR